MITGRVLNEVLEQRREIVDSVAARADNELSLAEWQALLSSYHSRLQLMAATHDVEGSRQVLVDLAAVAMAAVESMDRARTGRRMRAVA